ncbi:MAG TPA: isoprenylcysteine carboxylmethyltransferase family protein [Lacipirellulaceae bacterium]|nr:isoprenylcysteine carboxylmethyltransferase family protein [Lacipirellulaceae bacterium]
MTSPVAQQATHAKKINLRLFVPKLLFWPVIVFALVSQSVYVDGEFWDTTLEVVSFLILLVAAMGRVWVSAYISGRKNAELVTDGPYSMTRNPLYFFSFLGYIGAGLAFEKVTVAIAFGLLFFVTHWSTIRAEEKKLRSKFGDKFEQYTRQVPRFFPRPRKIALPDVVTFRPLVFNRAVLDCGLIMSVFILAHLIEYGQNAHVLPILIKGVP